MDRFVLAKPLNTSITEENALDGADKFVLAKPDCSGVYGTYRTAADAQRDKDTKTGYTAIMPLSEYLETTKKGQKTMFTFAEVTPGANPKFATKYPIKSQTLTGAKVAARKLQIFQKTWLYMYKNDKCVSMFAADIIGDGKRYWQEY